MGYHNSININPWLIGLIFLIIVFFLMINDFHIPNYFFFEDTKKTKAMITNISWTYGIRGTPQQILTYSYQVGNTTYTDSMEAGIGYDYKKIGDHLQVTYGLKSPQNNNVTGQYKSQVPN